VAAARVPARPRRDRSPLVAALAIVVVTSAAYAKSFDGVLVFDDEPAIASNPHIRRLWPLTESLSAPPDTTVSGRPIVSLSLAINYALAPADARDLFSAPAAAPPAVVDALGRNLYGYHLFNLSIHVAAALLLFGIVRRTLQTERMRARFGDAVTPLALAIAMLWAVHPLQTASVTYVVQRAESLMGLFYLLTLYCAIRAAQSGGDGAANGERRTAPNDERRTPNAERRTAPNDERRTTNHERRRAIPWWSVGAVAACALGMATKESMATAPLIVALWDFVFASDRASRRRLYLALASTWVVLGVLVAGGHRAHSVGFGFAEWPWPRYLLAQTGVVLHYLRLAVLPSPLVLDYEWPAARPIALVALQAVTVVALAGLTVWSVLRRSPIGFAGAWFFTILAPTSSVIPIATEVAADHRMYLPLAAVAALVVLGAFAALRGRFHAVAGLLLLSAAATFAVMTDARNREYQSVEAIWMDTVQKQPSNARAHTNYATALLLRGEYAAAEPHLREAVALRPDFAEAQADLGVALCARGAFEEGIAHIRQATAIRPDYAAAHRDLGEAHAASGNLAAAAQSFEKALDLSPNDVFLLNRLAWILATARDDGLRNGQRGVRLAEKAASLSARQDVDALDTLAAASAEVDRFDAAIAAGEEALALARRRPGRADVPDLERRLAMYRARTKIRE
jgi:protein O-mannosyl-transferase